MMDKRDHKEKNTYLWRSSSLQPLGTLLVLFVLDSTMNDKQYDSKSLICLDKEDGEKV